MNFIFPPFEISACWCRCWQFWGLGGHDASQTVLPPLPPPPMTPPELLAGVRTLVKSTTYFSLFEFSSRSITICPSCVFQSCQYIIPLPGILSPAPSSGLGFPGIYVQQGLDSQPKTPAASPPSSTSSTAATLGDKEDRKGFVSRVHTFWLSVWNQVHWWTC